MEDIRFDQLFYAVAFLVPGFLLHSTMSMFVPKKPEDAKLSLLRFITLSCINYAPWSWLVYLMFKTEFFLNSAVYSAAAWFLILFVSPVVIGFFTGHFSSTGAVRRALQRIGFNPVHVMDTAWDYKFASLQHGVWVRVFLKNGDQVGGWFGSKSFASSEKGNLDLYIEDTYYVNERGPFERIPRNDGLLIQADQIARIDFWKDEKE